MIIRYRWYLLALLLLLNFADYMGTQSWLMISKMYNPGLAEGNPIFQVIPLEAKIPIVLVCGLILSLTGKVKVLLGMNLFYLIIIILHLWLIYRMVG